MTGDREKYVWTPEQVEVTPPPQCQACRRRPADSEIAGLCSECAERIDADYEWLRDLGEWEAGP
jgi:hypothetical protein